MNKKELVMKYRGLVKLACGAYNLRNVFRIKKGKGNHIEAPCALMKNVNIQISGTGNTIVIDDFTTLKNTNIYINGNNNVVRIGKWTSFWNAEVCIEDDGNEVSIGNHTKIMGKTQLAAMEGTKILIGSECGFSTDIIMRTGDSHSILDMEGRRFNASKDIILEDHIWVGIKVICMKGTYVSRNSILAAGAVVSGKFMEPNCIIGGVPGKVIKKGIEWCTPRIPVGSVAEEFFQAPKENVE
jgi:acetyltransferase-like isoleucine patch superfamily enzyme